MNGFSEILVHAFPKSGNAHHDEQHAGEDHERRPEEEVKPSSTKTNVVGARQNTYR